MEKLAEYVTPPSHKVPDGENSVESTLPLYISDVSLRVADLVSLPLPMIWDGRFATATVSKRSRDRTPDMVVLDREKEVSGGTIRWDSIYALFELKGDSNKRKGLTSCARLMFGHQMDRRFVLAVTLLGTKMSLTVFNRSVTMNSAGFDIHEHPRLSLRVAVGLLFLNRATMGYDTTISLAHSTIQVNINTYRIKSIVSHEPDTSGRGTICVEVERVVQIFVIKNYWVEVTPGDKEWDLLNDAKGINHLAQLVEYQKLHVGGAVDSTEKDIRLANDDRSTKKKPEAREHVKVVLTPYGRPLWKFHSKHELLQVFIDVIDAHEKPYEEKGILHRDISLDNILITALGRGLLIGMDLAIRITDQLESWKNVLDQAQFPSWRSLFLINGTTIDNNMTQSHSSMCCVGCVSLWLDPMDHGKTKNLTFTGLDSRSGVGKQATDLTMWPTRNTPLVHSKPHSSAPS